MNEEKMREIYPQGDKLRKYEKQQIYRQQEKQAKTQQHRAKNTKAEKAKSYMRKMYPNWDSFTIDKKRKLLIQAHEDAQNQEREYAMQPKGNACIMFAILLGPIGIIVIIGYSVYIGQKSREFAERIHYRESFVQKEIPQNTKLEQDNQTWKIRKLEKENQELKIKKLEKENQELRKFIGKEK